MAALVLDCDFDSLLTRVSRYRPGPAAADLAELAHLLAEGLNLRRCVIELGSARTARWPNRIPVRHDGEQVGVLSLDSTMRQRMNRSRRRLLADLVEALGPVLYAARLRGELEDELLTALERAERIAAVRRQVFAERDQERRDLERDLHDGAQHHLVALRMLVGLLELQLKTGDLDAARAVLRQLEVQLEQADHVLLSTAAGACPPTLVDEGLVKALALEFARVPGPGQVRLSAAIPGRRYRPAVETAVYFSCLEAVNNARKHAPGATVVVRLHEDREGLHFSITDDGPGLGRDNRRGSFGLESMRERVIAAGGGLDVRTASDAGVSVSGVIPLQT